MKNIIIQQTFQNCKESIISISCSDIRANHGFRQFSRKNPTKIKNKIKGEDNMQENSMQETNNIEKEDVEIGQMVFVFTKTCNSICCLLTMTAQYLDKEGNVKNLYRILFNNNLIDIPEECITTIKAMPDSDKDEKFLKAFETKYDVQCINTDEEGNTKMGDESKILNDVIDNGIWDKMGVDEKKNLLDILRVDADTLIKLIDNYLKTMDVNEELYNKLCELSDDKIRIHNAVIEFTKKYSEVSNFVPGCKWAFDLLFYDALHMDEFLRKL